MENKEQNEENIREEYEYNIQQMKYKYILGAIILVLIAVIISVGITYYVTVGKRYDDLYKATSKVIEKDDEIITASESISDITTVLSVFARSY